MLKSWRPLVIAAALNLAGVGVAAAQTVIVRNAPPGAPVELAFDAATVATGTADAAGQATLPLNLSSLSKTEIDANIFVDVCDQTRRVVIAERLRTAQPPQPGCERRDIPGVYWVRPINTIVVDVGGFIPKVLLIKGSYTPPKPGATEAEEGGETKTPKRPSPTGLVLSGGLGLARFRDARTLACGNVTPCGGHDSKFGYTWGVTYWFTRWLAAEGTYLKPMETTATGASGTFTFDSSLTADIFTVVGKLAAPIGPVRLYGQAGMNYHQAISRTTDTVAGASQTFELRTHGWQLVFGGGGEGWITHRVALFGEVNVARIKGVDERGGEGHIDDRMRSLMGGMRVRLGRAPR
jgi:Outer membrane protein beta-barrel domain